MAETTVHAVVDRKGYTYRGNSLSKGQVVKMTEAQFASTQRINPPYFRRAKPEELKALKTAGGTIVDLAQVQAARAENVEEAAAAQEANPAPPKKK